MTVNPLKVVQDGAGANALGEFNPGDAIAPSSGGTGLDVLGTANQLLGVNADGTAAEYKTVVAGQSMAVIHTPNAITLDVTSQDGNNLINYYLGVR